MVQELKIKYNGIIKRQDKAMEWFDSEDYWTKFNSETYVEGGKKLLGGGVFFERCALKYKRLEDERIKILKGLDSLGVDVSIDEIVHGFEI